MRVKLRPRIALASLVGLDSQSSLHCGHRPNEHRRVVDEQDPALQSGPVFLHVAERNGERAGRQRGVPTDGAEPRRQGQSTRGPR